jgi:hypothetical protein
MPPALGTIPLGILKLVTFKPQVNVYDNSDTEDSGSEDGEPNTEVQDAEVEVKGSQGRSMKDDTHTKDSNAEIAVALDCATSEPLTSFSPLPELPFELRAEVFKLATEAEENNRLIICSPCYRIPVPALLHACTESRKEALKKYELVSPCNESRSVYVDLAHDVIFYDHWVHREGYGRWTFFNNANIKFLAKVQHLSIPAQVFQHLCQSNRSRVIPVEILPLDFQLLLNTIGSTVMNSQTMQSITIVRPTGKGDVLKRLAESKANVELGKTGILRGPRSYDLMYREYKIKRGWKLRAQVEGGEYLAVD